MLDRAGFLSSYNTICVTQLENGILVLWRLNLLHLDTTYSDTQVIARSHFCVDPDVVFAELKSNL